MSFRLRRKEINVKEECHIITCCITNTNFIKDIVGIAKKEYFVVPFAKTVWGWIEEYYKKYNEAPQRHIEDIFNVEKEHLDEAEADLIEMFLSDISSKYEESFNESYMSDKAIRYIKKRSLEEHITKMKSLLELDQVEEAEEEQVNFKKVSKLTSSWINPNDPDFIEKSFRDDKEKLVKFPGALGDLMGWLCRGWLIAVQAGYKKGKSWSLHEIRMLGLKARLNVVEINLEMRDTEIANRYYKRIMSRPDVSGNFLYPVFDCERNQQGTCKLKERQNSVTLYHAESEKPKGNEDVDKKYKPCTFCRNKKRLKENYVIETWFDNIKRDELDKELVIKKTKAFTKLTGNNYRLICYPRFSASIEDIERDLELLEYNEDFHPDIIVVDYADILRPSNENGEGNEEGFLNQIWMKLARLAGQKGALVATATQIKTAALNKRKSGMGDASWSARKYGHVDLMYSWSQTDQEKLAKSGRYSIISHRHRDFNEMLEVRVLQQLELGQAMIDSEFEELKEREE